MGRDGTGWAWLFGLLLFASLTLLVIVVARLMGGGISRTGSGGPRSNDEASRSSGDERAREILRERYARGELTTEEYQERLRNLGEDA